MERCHTHKALTLLFWLFSTPIIRFAFSGKRAQEERSVGNSPEGHMRHELLFLSMEEWGGAGNLSQTFSGNAPPCLQP